MKTQAAGEHGRFRYQPGHRFREWELIEPRGFGAFGEVWEARWASPFPRRPGLPERVALKVVQAPGSILDLVMAEADTARNLRHEHLITVYDWWSDVDGEVIFSLELADESLLDHIEAEGPLDGAAGRSFIEDILTGLAYLHGQRPAYLHLDLRASNVLRVGDTWKIADFGLCRPLSGPYTNTGTYNLSLRPPEALNSPIGTPTKLSPSWDVWAFGLLVHFALSGREPFEATTGLGRDLAAANGELTISPVIPQVIAGLIADTLQVDPSRRSPDAALMLSTWRAALLIQRRMPGSTKSPTDRAETSPPSLGAKITLGPEYLRSVGLDSLGASHGQVLLSHLHNTLKVRVGLLIAGQLSLAATDEFSAAPDDAAKLAILSANGIDSSSFVQAELKAMSDDLRARQHALMSGEIAPDKVWLQFGKAAPIARTGTSASDRHLPTSIPTDTNSAAEDGLSLPQVIEHLKPSGATISDLHRRFGETIPIAAADRLVRDELWASTNPANPTLTRSDLKLLGVGGIVDQIASVRPGKSIFSESAYSPVDVERAAEIHSVQLRWSQLIGQTESQWSIHRSLEMPDGWLAFVLRRNVGYGTEIGVIDAIRVRDRYNEDTTNDTRYPLADVASWIRVSEAVIVRNAPRLLNGADPLGPFNTVEVAVLERAKMARYDVGETLWGVTLAVSVVLLVAGYAVRWNVDRAAGSIWLAGWSILIWSATVGLAFGGTIALFRVKVLDLRPSIRLAAMCVVPFIAALAARLFLDLPPG